MLLLVNRLNLSDKNSKCSDLEVNSKELSFPAVCNDY